MAKISPNVTTFNLVDTHDLYYLPAKAIAAIPDSVTTVVLRFRFLSKTDLLEVANFIESGDRLQAIHAVYAENEKLQNLSRKSAVALESNALSLNLRTAINKPYKKDQPLEARTHTFKQECLTAIKRAKPELEKHSGWARLLQVLVDALTYAVTLGKVTNFSSQFNMFRTAAAKTLDTLEEKLNLAENEGCDPRFLITQSSC